MSRSIGRPSLLNPDRQAKICRLINDGNTRRVAAICSGIDPATLALWIKKGARAKTGKYRNFYLAVIAADAKSESKRVKDVVDAGQKNWQAAAWWLERRRPEEYGKRERVELAGDPDAPVQINFYLPDNKRGRTDDGSQDG